MKKLHFIIIIELFIILCLSAFLFNEYKNHQRSKELFINHAYFLLTDISDNLENTENMNDSSFIACMYLTRLDAICQVHQQETRSAFRYDSPGIFGEIVNKIYKNEYDHEELSMIASDIESMIQKLSNKSGIAENPNLSYEELNAIMEPFYSRWGR